ncbi:ABC transporter ATP-binding protein [Citricoccus zhacaiensis]|uniref:ABC transporter ATP-binding protein n=1 Tax=Citricoccus zhacaiensis TaxID=489142 RepID=A0ABQ2LZE6_9MICC|nr:ABC transporter ATP-binding protein [Citricoccus zhacaiensis]GGO45058.1 ABC transporter ATP-binding protein [Citricoccus zhacaiensis]
MNTTAPSTVPGTVPPSGQRSPAAGADPAGPETAATALHATGVHRQFGSGAGAVRAVNGVDLQIQRGEIVALLGPNGAGKTTFLDLVLGFTAPTSGSLTVLGMPPKQAVLEGRVGAVLQTGGLLSDLTVKETMSMVAACQPRHIPVETALERAGAAQIAGRKVRKCSGGEQQRLRFALALLTEPDLLLLDEPTAGMDVRARKEFWETMQAEAERGRTVVFATHFLQEASDFADRIVLMRAGRKVVDGPVDEVIDTGHRTVSCVWDGPGTPEEAAVKLGLPDAVAHQNGRVRFTAQDTDRLAGFLLSTGLAHDLTIAAASLDEVFLDLTSDDATEGTLT